MSHDIYQIYNFTLNKPTKMRVNELLITNKNPIIIKKIRFLTAISDQARNKT